MIPREELTGMRVTGLYTRESTREMEFIEA